MRLHCLRLAGSVLLGCLLIEAIAPARSPAAPAARSLSTLKTEVELTEEEVDNLQNSSAPEAATENTDNTDNTDASAPMAEPTPVETQADAEAENSEVAGSEAPAPSAEMAEMTEADGTVVILPPGYQANNTYPALVLMPYTDRTALHMFNWGMADAYSQRTEESFIVVMPPGQGSSANWSGGGWESFVEEYEAYVQQDLGPVVEKYNINPDQLVVGGFSLGGDLSWTLSLRNPEIFSGAIVMGSMSTYRDDQKAQQLAAKDFRYFMVMGGYDENHGSMQGALETLDEHRITYHYEEVGDAGHGDLPEVMANDLFLSAMDYVLSASDSQASSTLPEATAEY
jgi:enterochelin esterase-like enzyme